MNKQVITIPQFIHQIKLADSKMKKYYKRGDEIPLKYAGPAYTYKKDKLYNSKTKQFVIKNAASAGKPRLKSIAGNDIWMGVHERVRMAMVDAIEKNFEPHFPTKIDLIYPIKIDMDVYSSPRFADWDIGNLWIYDKVFQDMLVRRGLIPNDNIKYVTKASGPRYIPIVDDSERRMVFTLSEDDDPVVRGHILYELSRIKQPVEFEDRAMMYAYNMSESNRVLYRLVETSQGEPGSTFVDSDNLTIHISVGKTKVIHGAVRRALKAVFSLAVQLNSNIGMNKGLFDRYQNFVGDELVQRGIAVFFYKYDEGKQVQGTE